MSLHLLIIMQSSVLFNYMMITRCATIITSVLLYLTTNEHSTPINLFPCVKNHAVVSYMWLCYEYPMYMDLFPYIWSYTKGCLSMCVPCVCAMFFLFSYLWRGLDAHWCFSTLDWNLDCVMSTRYSLLVNNQAVFSYILNLDYIMSTRYTWIFFLIFDHIQRDVCRCVFHVCAQCSFCSPIYEEDSMRIDAFPLWIGILTV